MAAEKLIAADVTVGKPKISLAVKDDAITVTVKKTENAEGYLVYLKAEGSKKYSLAGKIEKDGTAKRKFTISGLADGSYSVRVKAYSGETYSKYSKVKKVQISFDPSITYSEDGVRLSNNSSDFVLITDVVPDAILEIRYYSTYNFVGDRIDGYEEPLAFLTKEAAAALKEVSDELVEKGYRLKIFDAYRPQKAVTNFMNWALDAEDTRMKEYFYPELEKDVLFPQGYIAEHSGHSRGSTVDLTLFDMTTEKEVDMGGTFDYFGELSHPDYTDITEEQYANRMLLREVMLKHGFKPLEEEWWHFTLENEPYPDTYFTFSVNSVNIRDEAPDVHAEILSYWNDDAKAKKEIVSYMEAITKAGSKDYIPVERRIAVFDLDGTLYCETDPNYFDHMLLAHRILDDEDYRDRASDFEKKVAADVLVMNETGVQAENMEVNHGTAVASSFKGFTPDEFYDYIAEYKKTPMVSYEGMTLGEAFYRPMLQIVEFLEANDFTVFVVSGTDRFIVRGLIKDSMLNIPNNHIIGSDETLVAPDQGDTDGLNYVYDDNDKVVFGGDFIIKNLKMNKVTVIVQEIGIQPVLSFGNSTGDSSMAEYVTTGNPYKSLAFMLCCDDTERENGSISKADKMRSLCEQYDWVPVSMKNDWTTIYGDGVKKKSK
ncbi:MAG: haloacid dehalogenase-like hydrolase [Lachnospiraceae bacterium]|nr:haloacid dehalogenase-like hydrolase [Lachnospiraceae bacterium]